MIHLRRFLLFLSEAGTLVLGFVVSFALAEVVDPDAVTLAFTVLFSGLFVTLVLFLLIVWKHRPKKLEYDAACYTLSRAARKLHPGRVKLNCFLWRTLLCVPNAFGALVLFFLPVASHLLHPSSRYLTHYSIPIPWTATILRPFALPGYSYITAFVSSSGRGRYGVTPFLERPLAFSSMDFFSDPPTAVTGHTLSTEPNREFRLGEIPLQCWQRVNPRITLPGWPVWVITCETPADVNEYNFHASFVGREEDIPAFYKIIDGVTPVE